jgi:hypothetical protein
MFGFVPRFFTVDSCFGSCIKEIVSILLSANIYLVFLIIQIMKFPDKTIKFNFNHSPKAINSLITQSACAYLDLVPRVKRMLTEIYFIIQ